LAIYKTVLIIFPLNLQTMTITLDVVKWRERNNEEGRRGERKGREGDRKGMGRNGRGRPPYAIFLDPPLVI